VRYMLLLVLVLFPGCGTFFATFQVDSRPEGLEVNLQGYRLLLRDVYHLDVRVRNVGEGVYYMLNDREVLIRTGRAITLDGEPIEMELGEVREILPVSRMKKP